MKTGARVWVRDLSTNPYELKQRFGTIIDYAEPNSTVIWDDIPDDGSGYIVNNRFLNLIQDENTKKTLD